MILVVEPGVAAQLGDAADLLARRVRDRDEHALDARLRSAIRRRRSVVPSTGRPSIRVPPLPRVVVEEADRLEAEVGAVRRSRARPSRRPRPRRSAGHDVRSPSVSRLLALLDSPRRRAARAHADEADEREHDVHRDHAERDHASLAVTGSSVGEPHDDEQRPRRRDRDQPIRTASRMFM